MDIMPGTITYADIGHPYPVSYLPLTTASFPEIMERTVIYGPIGLTGTLYERPWRSADDAYRGMSHGV